MDGQGLYRVNARHSSQRTKLNRIMEALHAGTSQRTSAHLHKHPVELALARRQFANHLIHQRLAALDGQSVVRTLTRERQGAAAYGLLQAVIRGITARAGLTWATRDLRAEVAQLRRHLGVGRRGP